MTLRRAEALQPAHRPVRARRHHVEHVLGLDVRPTSTSSSPRTTVVAQFLADVRGVPAAPEGRDASRSTRPSRSSRRRSPQAADGRRAGRHGLDPGDDVPDGLRRAPCRGGAGAPRSPSTGFWIDRTPGHQPPASPRFVAATGYVTVAERPLDPAAFPGAPAENLVPGSLVFRRTARPGRPAAHGPVVDVDARRVLARTRGPGLGARRPRGRTRSSTSPTRTPRRYADVGRRARCRPRRSGSSPRAAGSTARRTSGATSPSRRASGSRTTGTATSRGAPDAGYGTTAPVGSFPPNGLRPVRHGRQRLGVDDRLVRRQPSARASIPAPDPAVRDPAQGRQGRLVPVRRQLLPALPPRRSPPADDRHRHEPRRLPPARSASPRTRARAASAPGRRPPPRRSHRSVAGHASGSRSARSATYSTVHGPMPGSASSAARVAARSSGGSSRRPPATASASARSARARAAGMPGSGPSTSASGAGKPPWARPASPPSGARPRR